MLRARYCILIGMHREISTIAKESWVMVIKSKEEQDKRAVEARSKEIGDAGRSMLASCAPEVFQL